MACISGWYSAELLKRDADEEMRHLRPHLDLLKAMGSTVLVFAETSNAIHGDRSKPLLQRPFMKAGDWAEFGRRITEVAERTLAEGVRLVYHHHIGTIVESAADIDAFMAATGEAAHLLLDTGHATWGGADPAALARRYRARISHFHAKDVRRAVMEQARREDWSFLSCFSALAFASLPGVERVEAADVPFRRGGACCTQDARAPFNVPPLKSYGTTQALWLWQPNGGIR